LNVADIFWGIILFIGAFQGFRKGLIIEVINIFAFMLAILGGIKLMDAGIRLLEPHLSGIGKLLPLLSFILIFVIIVLVVSAIGFLLKKFIHLTPLGIFDHLAGAIVGILKWGLTLSIILWFLSFIDIQLPGIITNNSLLLPYISAVAPGAVALATQIFPALNSYFEIIQQRLEGFVS